MATSRSPAARSTMARALRPRTRSVRAAPARMSQVATQVTAIAASRGPEQRLPAAARGRGTSGRWRWRSSRGRRGAAWRAGRWRDRPSPPPPPPPRSVMRALDGWVRIMSSARRSRTTPPATLNAARVTPSQERMAAPASAKKARTTKAVTEARSAALRLRRHRVAAGHRQEERDRGDRVDDEEERRERDQEAAGDLGEHCPFPYPPNPENRIDQTLRTASSRIRRDIFDWPTRRSSKTIGSSCTRKPLRTAR